MSLLTLDALTQLPARSSRHSQGHHVFLQLPDFFIMNPPVYTYTYNHVDLRLQDCLCTHVHVQAVLMMYRKSLYVYVMAPPGEYLPERRSRELMRAAACAGVSADLDPSRFWIPYDVTHCLGMRSCLKCRKVTYKMCVAHPRKWIRFLE